MGEATILGLLWIGIAATLAPIVVDIIPRFPVPVVVVEILLGILFGPEILHLIEHSEGLEVAKEFGVIFLFFLAGFEVDYEGIKGSPLRNALGGWVGSIVIALGIALLLQQMGYISSFHLIAIAITTTALGPLMPIMQDSGLLHTRFGSHVLSIGAVGEFVPVLAIAFLFNESRTSLVTGGVLTAFLLMVGVGLYIFRRGVAQNEGSHTRRIAVETLQSSAQFAVRLSVLVLVVLVYLAMRFDLDVLLGAFAGGFIVGQLGDVASTVDSRKVMEWMKVKLEAIGFGVFIPAFFVMTGADLKLDILFNSERALLFIPLTVIAFLIVRGLPIMVLYREMDFDARWRLGLVAATQLPLVATLMHRFVEAGKVPEDIANAVIAGSVLTVALFPLIALMGFSPDEPATSKRSAHGGPTNDDTVVEGLPEITKNDNRL